MGLARRHHRVCRSLGLAVCGTHGYRVGGHYRHKLSGPDEGAVAAFRSACAGLAQLGRAAHRVFIESGKGAARLAHAALFPSRFPRGGGDDLAAA